MQISEILTQSAVKTVSAVTSKKRLFQEISEIAHAAHGIPADLALGALLERESLGPTGVGHGVALPHARVKDLHQVVAVFLRVERPLDFDSADRHPVDLFFALFAPESAGVNHLKALALVSRTMRNKDVCTKLRSNTNSAALHAILTEVEEPKAA
ncbi:PTS sugar transporter subunit IIA [Litoreibacter janthinus]|uniref:PTS IIA-like nitrogen-regulatory protein PtsN n=1 Tax=Litoreibacter janthinus TaxID=670154 RepID=A0A1I6FYX2_9RHOB|nr:PTS sugar transporter subunit IIA [Litoreibacter janthinus]SFR35155.1 PTS IIA-like nitrogen-regulatory protein PtsN [Litoreibacter janthinus]